jgi:hypothetical protein
MAGSRARRPGAWRAVSFRAKAWAAAAVSLACAGIAAGVILVPAASPARPQPRPVPRALLSDMTAHSTERIITGTAPSSAVSLRKAEAAARAGFWFKGTVITGVSYARIDNLDRDQSVSAWLFSLHAPGGFYAPSGGPPPPPDGGKEPAGYGKPVPETYCVDLVNAKTGEWIETDCG